MASSSKTTQDHDEIRKWAEERGGKPSHVESTGTGDDVGILRIDFPGYSGEGSLQEISWEEFFEKFDEHNLALLYQEETAEGEKSNFNKLVSAATAEANEERTHAAHTGRGRKTAGATAKKAATKSASGSSAPKTATPAPAKKSVANRGTTAKKAAPPVATKTAAKKVAAKKAPAKKAPVKKVAAKKVAAKSIAKKTAPVTKKAAPKKVAAKKTAPKKAAPKRAAAKKVAAKKGPGRPPKKASGKRR